MNSILLREKYKLHFISIKRSIKRQKKPSDKVQPIFSRILIDGDKMEPFRVVEKGKKLSFEDKTSQIIEIYLLFGAIKILK